MSPPSVAACERLAEALARRLNTLLSASIRAVSGSGGRNGGIELEPISRSDLGGE